MTFRPFTSPELTQMRTQRKRGWTLDRVASFAGRSPSEVDTALWMMMGRWREIAPNRARVNRILSKREAEVTLAPIFGVAA